MPKDQGQASPARRSTEPAAPAPVERFEPDRFRDELVEAEHVVRYLWAAGAVDGREVLDAGCGAGYGCALMAERGGARRCLGIDISEQAIADARAAYGADERLDFEIEDITRLALPDESVDVVTCFETIEHVAADAQHLLLGECARVLGPGGLLLISSPNRTQYPPGNPHHVRELTDHELRALLSERFAHVVLMRQHNWLASAIFDDESFSASEAQDLDLEVGKLQGRGPGSELYTLAVCSDEPVSWSASRALLTHGLEVRRWIEEIELQKQGQEEARRTLAEVERELMVLRDERSVTVGRLQDRVYWLDRAQVDLDSWMRRRPLRFALKLLARLLRSRRALRR